MTFTFVNYAAAPLQQSPLANLVSGLLGGYEQGTRAQFLRPALEEELKKAQQYNKYYGPNIESQMGLRGAQAGHANALTTGQNITNRYLEPQLQAQLQALQSAAQEKQYFNDLLKRRLSGQSNQPDQPGLLGQQGIQQQIQQQMQQPQYQPGQGQAPLMEQQQSPLLQQGQPQQLQQAQQPQRSPFAEQVQPQQISSAMEQQGTPQLTDEDILNKHLFKIDTFTPKYKAYVDSVAKTLQKKDAEKFKLEAKQDYDTFKEIESARTDLPVLDNALQSALRMREIIINRPAFWGHYLTPGYFAKTATDELAGEFQSKLVPQMAATESQLSQRGNQLALKISESKLPSFADSQQVALGKVNGLIDEIQKRLGVTQDLAGGNIRKIGGKRFKMIDGEWYELEKGEQ